MVVGEYAFCKNDGEMFHIRGTEACLKCQLEFLWDYAEGTRRMVEQGEIVWGPGSQPSPREQGIAITEEEYDALPKIIRDQLNKVKE